VAGFKTHISTSTVVGVAYGYWGVTDQGMSLESGLLAGGLCSVSGMLPDLDSDSGVPLRETSMFLAAIAPMLMIDRWRDMGLTHESMALAAMLIYIAIRFVAVEFFKRYTVHRGMWHSIPAAITAGLIAYLLMPSPSEAIRVYKSLAVFVGFMTHLILDEIWSLDFSRGFRVKKSFGTALKFFGSSWWVNLTIYAKLGFLIYVAHGDHEILDRLRQRIRLDREQYAIPQPEPVPSYLPSWDPGPATPAVGDSQPGYFPYQPNGPVRPTPPNQFVPQQQPQPPQQRWSQPPAWSAQPPGTQPDRSIQSEPSGNRVAAPPTHSPAPPY
jgi:membrane-bound metal-dependent hydrolase YbcI (DUF457 family)